MPSSTGVGVGVTMVPALQSRIVIPVGTPLFTEGGDALMTESNDNITTG